jgi:ankyrin repeat protein
LAAGADPNAADEYLWTPLHLAAYYGHHDCLISLLEAGADVNAADDEQWSPLHLAAHSGHHDCLVALVAAGAKVNGTTENLRTALYYAAQNGYQACVVALLGAGADVAARDKEGKTARDMAPNYRIYKFFKGQLKHTQTRRVFHRLLLSLTHAYFKPDGPGGRLAIERLSKGRIAYEQK